MATRDELLRILVTADPEILVRLRLSAADAARVCAVTPRQLIYWTRRGLVATAGGDGRGYDVLALTKVIRIRRGLASGLSLEKAAAESERAMALLAADAARLSAMNAEELDAETGARFARLDARVAEVRRSLPLASGLERLREAVARLAGLEAEASTGHSSDPDAVRILALRIGRAADELEKLLSGPPGA